MFIPQDAVPFFLDEMEKCAVAIGMELGDNARSYGIRAKKTGKDDRGLAYSKGIGAAGAAGAGLGAATGAVTGKATQISLLRKGGTAKAVQEGVKDYLTLKGAARKAGVNSALEGGIAAAKELQEKGWSSNTDATVKKVTETATDSLTSPGVKRVLARRGRAALGAAGLAAAAGAVGKAAPNAATYEASKTLATRPGRKKGR